MAALVTITVLLELDDKIQNPERVGKQASEAFAKLLEDTYVKVMKDPKDVKVKTLAISYSEANTITLPGKEVAKK